MNRQQARFITVEGGEGGGKTTNMTFIRDWLARNGVDFVATREPGGTPLAEEIRGLLVTPREERVDENTELLLMFAARAQHLSEVIRPALDAGKWVLCDRFTDATYAYQGAGRGVAVEKIAQLESLVQDTLRPDLTLLLDIPVELGMARACGRGAPDRFEREKLSFFNAVRDCYLARAAAEPTRYRVINASQPLADVQRVISDCLEPLLDHS